MRFAYLIEPPFNYVDNARRVTGCDVELARHIIAELGIAAFEPVATEFAELLPGLSDGRWRMTTGLFATDERRKSAQFSRPIWALGDGLLVAKGNPLKLSGYQSVADTPNARIAVIRDQFQHRAAVEAGIGEDRITVFETYAEAATAVKDRRVDAYASVARAHAGFIELNADWPLALVAVPPDEKAPAFGSFAFGLGDTKLLGKVNAILAGYLGSTAHRDMMARFGFSDDEVDLVAAINA